MHMRSVKRASQCSVAYQCLACITAGYLDDSATSKQRICLQGRQLPAAAAAAGRRARAGLQEVGRAGQWQPGRHHALTIPWSVGGVTARWAVLGGVKA